MTEQDRELLYALWDQEYRTRQAAANNALRFRNLYAPVLDDDDKGHVDSLEP